MNVWHRFGRCALVLACASLAWGISSAAMGQEVREVKLTFAPAAAPRPAMKFRLLPGPAELKPGNAAALYYRSVIMYRESHLEKERTELSEHGFDTLDKPITAADRPVLDRLLAAFAKVIHEAHLGARRSRCEWDIPIFDDGIDTLLPEVQDFRAISRLLMVQARVQIADGNFEAALTTLQTNFAMSLHVGQSGTLISSLVGLACANIGMQRLEEFFEAPGAPNLYWALTEFPAPLIDLSVGLDSERAWMVAEVPYHERLDNSILSAAQSRELAGKLETLLRFNESEPANSTEGLSYFWTVLKAYPAARRDLIAAGRDPQWVDAMPAAQVVAASWTRVYRENIDEALAWKHRPYWEIRPSMQKLDDHFQSLKNDPQGLLSTIFLPAVTQIFTASARTDRQVAMLRVIEALRLYAATHDGSLPQALSDIEAVAVPLDPATGKEFDYRLEEEMAVLRPPAPRVMPYETRYEIRVRQK